MNNRRNRCMSSDYISGLEGCARGRYQHKLELCGLSDRPYRLPADVWKNDPRKWPSSILAASTSLFWKHQNIVVLGDFNAGGTYVRTDDWKNIRRLRDNLNFHWLIDDNVDTAVLGLPKAYDRIVVTTDMKKGVLKAGVFKAYGLGDQALAVSDHFPVEVELKPLRNAKKRGRESDETSPKDYPVGIFLQPRSIE